MTPDKDIQELFDSAKVRFADNDAFIDALNRRLDKVEFIKETQDVQIRRYKASMVWSLIAGLVVGAGSMVLLQTLPAAVFGKISAALAGIPIFGMDNPVTAISTGVALLAGTAAFLIVRNVQEIGSMMKPLFAQDDVVDEILS